VGFGLLGCHQVGQGLADDKRAVETLQGSHVKKAIEQCLSAPTHCLGVARPSSLSCRNRRKVNGDLGQLALSDVCDQ
jgi:hypothetical protein